MKNIESFNSIKEPVWSIIISNDPVTNISRKIESDGLLLLKDVVRLKTIMYQTDTDGNKLEGSRFVGVPVDLDAFNDSRGPFINPSTGSKVLPNEDNEVEDSTILRYTAIMSNLNSPAIIEQMVIQFVQAADLNGEFNI